MQLPAEIKSAEDRIRDHVRHTPIEDSKVLGDHADCTVILKLENHQRTGSFKLRGAFNKMLLLDESARKRGVVAASTGNHGSAVACAAHDLGVEATVFAPTNADSGKLEAIRSQGAQIRTAGDDCLHAEHEARQFCMENDRTYISPYNDTAVIAGQGTIGVELSRQIEDLDVVFMSVGGGGLLSGVASYLKSVRPGIEIVACSPANSCVMHESLQAGELLDLPSEPTLSDGTAGGVEKGSITFELCRQLVDRSILVTEEEIASAMRLVIRSHHVLVEGAAGVAVAGFLRDRDAHAGRKVAIILCGANASLEVLGRVLA